MRNASFCALALLGLVLGSCQVNAVGLGAPPTGTLPFVGIAETAGPDEALVFAPTSGISPGSVAFGSGGIVYMGCGGATKLKPGQASVSNPEGLALTTNYTVTPLLMGPFPGLCPSNNCKSLPAYRGVGGPAGDFANDYFVRFAGYKGPNASTDYGNMTLRFSSGGGVPYDISAYRGIIFWARGHGNFAVSLAGRKPGDGLSPPVTPATAAYQDWNFYLRRFGNELNGDEQWKQIIVFFSDMVQEYGLAVDLNNVLKKCTGLQFDQQAPYTADFRLDVDYVRFFK